MIYFDNAATTRMYEECTEILTKYNSRCFFNPSARYDPALEVTLEVRAAREKLAKLLNVQSQCLYFTSSGSESDNLAIFGTVKRSSEGLIVSATEHSAVFESAKELKNRGFDVKIAPVKKDGSVDVTKLAELVDQNTKLVSVMHVNNETGAVNDLHEICKVVKAKNPKVLVHSDGVQAFGKIKTDLKYLDVDLYTFCGHKIHAPKGVAALYVKKGVNVRPIIYGGGQESGLRSSTENVSGIIAFAKAAEIITQNMAKTYENGVKIIKYITKELSDEFGSLFSVNTDVENCSGAILNFSIKGIMGEVLLHTLESSEIYISTGSACSTKKGVSRIPAALGLSEEWAKGTVRLSFDENSTLDEARIFCEKCVEAVKNLLNYKKK